MARPLKDGLEYYPLDVDFLRDIKVRKIKRSYGTQAIELLLCLLGNIYRDTGYYLRWDEDSIFLVADEIGAKEGLVKDVVKKAVQVGFFNEEKFDEYKILTSRGIQKRYLKASERRKRSALIQEYLVNDDNNSTITGVNVDNNSTSSGVNVRRSTQSKVKESKVNKSKVNNNNNADAAGLKKSPINHWSEIYGNLNKVQRDVMTKYQTKFSSEIILEGIDRTALSLPNDNNGGAFKYLQTILRAWENAGVKTMADIRHQDIVYKTNKINNSKKTWKTKEIATDWSKVHAPKPSYTDEQLNNLLDEIKDKSKKKTTESIYTPEKLAELRNKVNNKTGGSNDQSSSISRAIN